jgi:protein transport protein SEC24
MQQQQQQQQVQPRPGMPPQQQSNIQQQPGLASQMASMNIGGQQQAVASPPPGVADLPGPAKTKRSARAYHQDAPIDPTAGTDAGWNDAPPNPVQQMAWQKAAADRLAQYGDQPHDFEGDANDALDQVPGQRNVLHPHHAAANQQRMAQSHPQQRQANLPITPGAPGPHTPAAVAAGSQFFGAQTQGPGGISQPPHQAGQKMRGPKANIDPDQVPAPIEPQEADQAFFDKEWFTTCGRGGLPLSTTDYGAADQGESREMSYTWYTV